VSPDGWESDTGVSLQDSVLLVRWSCSSATEDSSSLTTGRSKETLQETLNDYGREVEIFEKAGITDQDTIIYNIDKMIESIDLALTFDKQEKSEKMQDYEEEEKAEKEANEYFDGAPGLPKTSGWIPGGRLPLRSPPQKSQYL